MVVKIRTTYKKSRFTAKGVNVSEIASEHDLQKYCVAKLRFHNMLCVCTDLFNSLSFIKDVKSKAIYKQHMIAMGGMVGIPDLIIIHQNKVTFVEFKWGKGKKSPEQIAVCNKLESLGYEVLEWRELQDCTDWICKQLKEKSQNACVENS